MKKIITIFIFILFVANAFAQNEVRNFENITSLKVSLPFNVVLIQGLNEKIEIEGLESEYLDNIKSEMNNGELSIFTKGKIKSKQEVTVTISFKHLNEIKLSGALDVSTLDVIRENELKIKGSGAIEADLNLEVPKLSIEFSGASDLKLRGLADTLTLKTSGASDINASNFIAKNVIVGISGASDAKVYASESIRGTATGASSVSVKGSPAIKAINKSGASSASYGGSKKIIRINKIDDIDGVTIEVGNQHLEVEDEDIDVRLGNKEAMVRGDGDTVRLKWGSTELIVIDDSVRVVRTQRKRRRHWAGVDIAVNGFLNAKKGFDLTNDPSQRNVDPEKVTQFMELNYAKSWSFSINFMEF
ncbi:MAG: head GIN domain-containing protein, partial [Vicingaceae bacterium]